MKKMIKKNNKGIAMVTIMITIMFLSVIATALLYISASNYSMKVANTYGKANYYETDGTLVKATSAIRNSVIKSSSAIDLSTQSFVNTAPTDTTNGTYNITEIAKLVYPGATGSATSATVNVSSVDALNAASATGDTINFKTKNNTIVKGTAPAGVTARYVFKDIEIVQTSAKGYENSVKTDLIVDVLEKVSPGGSAGGVGNMSMLLDSPLSSTAANFKNLTMTGNAFIADYGSVVSWGGAYYVAPGSNGLVMTNESRLNLCGDNNVVYGDLKLSGNSSLAVYGDLTVYGDISVTGKATLIVAEGGHVYQLKSTALPGRAAPSSFNADSAHAFNITDSTDIPVDNYKSFADTIGIKSSTASNSEYGLIKKIFKKGPKNAAGSQPFGATKRLIDLDSSNVGFGKITCNAVSAGNPTMNNNTFDLGRGYKLNSDLMHMPKFGLGFIERDANTSSMNASDYNYRLMISFNQTPVILQQSTPHSTWICKSAVSCSQAHCVVLSKVGTTQFNYMTAGKGDSESQAYDNNNNPFNSINIKFGSTTFTGKFGAFFEQDCNTYVDQMFGYSLPSGGGGGVKTYSTSVSFDNYERDFDL